MLNPLPPFVMVKESSGPFPVPGSMFTVKSASAPVPPAGITCIKELILVFGIVELPLAIAQFTRLLSTPVKSNKSWFVLRAPVKEVGGFGSYMY